MCFITSDNIKNIIKNKCENIDNYITTLDTNVTYLSTCLGYRSTEKVEQDQGFVIAYVKDSKVYYISYYFDTTISAMTLSSPTELGNYTNAIGVNITRTNDYRLAFIVHTADNENYVHITERSYIGSAVRDEIGNVNSIKYLNYITLSNIANTVSDLLNRNTYLDVESKHKIIIEYSTNLYNPYHKLDSEFLKQFITVTTTSGTVLDIDTIEIEHNKLIITFTDEVQFNVNIKYNCNDIYNCLYLNLSSVNNMGGIYPIPSFTQYLKCREDLHYNSKYEIANLSSIKASTSITLKEIPKVTLPITEIGNINNVIATAIIKLPYLQKVFVNSEDTATYKIDNELGNINCIKVNAIIKLEHTGTNPI